MWTDTTVCTDGRTNSPCLHGRDADGCADSPRPHGHGLSMWMRTSVHADVANLPIRSFLRDTIVPLNHGHLRSHCPHPRPCPCLSA